LNRVVISPDKMAKPKAKAKKKAAKKTVALRVSSARSSLRQYGVIPVRRSRKGDLQVLLLTSRGTGRWVIPKGWPMAKRTPAGTARREAYEEAGIKGSLLSRRPIGTYRYEKPDHAALGEIQVAIFVLSVETQEKDWPECEERRTRWFPVERAASLVKERELARLLRSIPRLLDRSTNARRSPRPR
jgi:8-oxo-dGTP pyrophosphatase MutT (NUDIX family)